MSGLLELFLRTLTQNLDPDGGKKSHRKRILSGDHVLLVGASYSGPIRPRCICGVFVTSFLVVGTIECHSRWRRRYVHVSWLVWLLCVEENMIIADNNCIIGRYIGRHIYSRPEKAIRHYKWLSWCTPHDNLPLYLGLRRQMCHNEIPAKTHQGSPFSLHQWNSRVARTISRYSLIASRLPWYGVGGSLMFPFGWDNGLHCCTLTSVSAVSYSSKGSCAEVKYDEYSRQQSVAQE